MCYGIHHGTMTYRACRQERHRYYSNRQQSFDNPDHVISMIIDGMDQNKTNLPGFVRITKSCQNLWCLRTHLTGCLVHGHGFYGFFDFLQFSHDTNLTLTCILLTLIEVCNTAPVPRRLLIQMDNCVRENKNKYVFGFLAYLVEVGIFSEVILTLLAIIIPPCTIMQLLSDRIRLPDGGSYS